MASAQALVDYLETEAARLRSISFGLPGFRLEIVADSDGYEALCRRALVNLAGAGEEQLVRLIVSDYGRRPDMPRVTFANPAQLGDLDGRYDAEFDVVQLFDHKTSFGIEVLGVARRYPPWIESFPLRNLMHWAYSAAGWRIVHGGTLGSGGVGVLLVGAGGAGKSGTTLSGILGGLDSVGDDYVAIELTEGAARAYPLMKLMKQDAAGLSRLGITPDEVGAGQLNWQGKYEFDPTIMGRGTRAENLDLRAILIPQIVSGSRSNFTAIPSRLAMLALAPNNLRQSPGDWREGIGFTAELARRLPAYRLELGSDPSEIADAIRGFIERLGA